MKTRAGERAFQVDIHSVPSWNLSVLMRQIEMEAVASLHQTVVRLASQPRDTDSNRGDAFPAAR